MNKRDLAKFEKILSRERERITKEIKNLESENTYKETLKDVSGYGIHMAEAGNEELELEKNLMFLSREGDILSKIDEALAKIKKGTYGICERTGKPIPKERLVAKPFAKYCLEARLEVERLGLADDYS